MKVLHNGQAIIIRLDKIDKEFLDAHPDLKVIGAPTTGLDHIDLEECAKRNIKVMSLRGQQLFLKYITSTTEHTVGLIIALLRNYKTALNGPYQDREEYKGHTLSDKVLGIIGFGRVGKQVKKAAVGLSMTVITHDLEEYYLQNLLEESDIVTLHIPLLGNEGYFTKDMFQLMKPNACLINTSRDKIIEKGALLWALENKIIAGAAVDFIEDGNLVEYARTHDNLILTNHLGGCTEEDMQKTEEHIINLVNNYLHEQRF